MKNRITIENVHVILGLCILYITIFRLYKILNPTPKVSNNIFPGQRIIARINHILYVSILVITISGALKKLFNGEPL